MFETIIFVWVVVVPPFCLLIGKCIGAQDLDKDFEGEQQS